MSVKGLYQIELKPQQLVGVIAIHADVLLGHVLVALTQKSQPREPGRNDLDCYKCLQLRPALNRVDDGQCSVQRWLIELVERTWL